MPNETQIECYFKSADMEALCQGTTGIVVHFKASYPPDAPPTFEISADGFNEEGDVTKSIASASTSSSPSSAPGCPRPCP